MGEKWSNCGEEEIFVQIVPVNLTTMRDFEIFNEKFLAFLF